MIYVSQPQKCLTYLGYYGDTFVRKFATDIEKLTRPMPQEDPYCAEMGERLKRVVSAICSFPLAITLSIPALGCYSLAACSGSGRFEWIEGTAPTTVSNHRSIKVMSLNVCFQDPWSPLTGGIVLPQEPVGHYPSRVAAVVDAIARRAPHVFLGQEVDSLGAQDEFIHLMQKEFRYFLRDLGCDNPNPIPYHSGLFVASQLPLHNVNFVPYPY